MHIMTNTHLNYWKKYCCEPLELVESYAAAKADNFAGWCIHHRLEIQQDGIRVSRQELKDKDLYYGRPASELIFMRFGEHTTLHTLGNTNMKGKHHSEESRLKMSESCKSRNLSEEYHKKLSESLSGENNPFFGKHHSEETRRKISESCKGKPGWLKGKHQSEDTCQKISEASKGMHWWNNGISSTHSRECPGEGWTRGRLRFKV